MSALGLAESLRATGQLTDGATPDGVSGFVAECAEWARRAGR